MILKFTLKQQKEFYARQNMIFAFIVEQKTRFQFYELYSVSVNCFSLSAAHCVILNLDTSISYVIEYIILLVSFWYWNYQNE